MSRSIARMGRCKWLMYWHKILCIDAYCIGIKFQRVKFSMSRYKFRMCRYKSLMYWYKSLCIDTKTKSCNNPESEVLYKSIQTCMHRCILYEIYFSKKMNWFVLTQRILYWCKHQTELNPNFWYIYVSMQNGMYWHKIHMSRSIVICVDARLNLLSLQTHLYRQKTCMSQLILNENCFYEVRKVYVLMHAFFYRPKRLVHD